MTSIDIPKENRLIKHSAAVHISNEITVIDRKIYNVLLRNAFNQKKDGVYTISILEIIKDLGHEKYKNYEFIEAAVQKLAETFITFNILKKDKKKKWLGTIAMLSQAVAEGGGNIKYSFPPFLESSFFSPNIYASLNLEYQKNLHSKHSLAIWEFCTEQLDSAKLEKVTTRAIDLPTLRSLLGANDAYYNEFKFLNSKVIKPAIKEVNKVADINIEVSLVKDRRTVTGIIFTIERKSKNINIDIDPEGQSDLFHTEGTNIIKLLNDTIEEQDLSHIAREIGITEDFLAKIKTQYTQREIKTCFDFLRSKVNEKHKIKNIQAYLITLLNKGVFEEKGTETAYEPLIGGAIKEKEHDLTNGEDRFYPFVERLKIKFGQGIYISWMLRMKYLRDDERTIYYSVPSQFTKQWVEEKYHQDILLCFKECGFSYKYIEFEVIS